MQKSFLEKTWGIVVDRASSSRRGALLWVLVIAIERRLPLVPVLEAFAKDSRGIWSTYALQLAAALRSGASLPDALAAIPGAVPNSAVLAARVGAESGTLGPALRIAAETYTVQQDVSYLTPRGTFIYLFVLFAVMINILAFLMMYIIPKFKAIFNDFDTEIPTATNLVIDISDKVAEFWPLVVPLMMLMFAVAAVSFILGYGNYESWSWLGNIVPRLRAPDVLRSLAVVIQAGRPIGSALTSLVGYHPDYSIRKRLALVEKDVQSGADAWTSLLHHKLLRRAEAAVLKSAQHVGNLPWALRNTADRIDRGLRHRFLIVMELLRPVALLAIGVLVGGIVIGMFMPLVKLLNDFS